MYCPGRGSLDQAPLPPLQGLPANISRPRADLNATTVLNRPLVWLPCHVLQIVWWAYNRGLGRRKSSQAPPILSAKCAASKNRHRWSQIRTVWVVQTSIYGPGRVCKSEGQTGPSSKCTFCYRCNINFAQTVGKYTRHLVHTKFNWG